MYPDNYDLNFEDDKTIAFFSLPYEAFNNWSAHKVKIFGYEFQTAEAAFQYAKFKDSAPDLARQILEAPSPWQVFQIAKANRDKTPPDWKQSKLAIMEQIIRTKVDQNSDVKQRLMDSGTKTIMENSPWDSFWGAGPDGKGENNLGKIYMKIRKEIAS